MAQVADHILFYEGDDPAEFRAAADAFEQAGVPVVVEAEPGISHNGCLKFYSEVFDDPDIRAKFEAVSGMVRGGGAPWGT